MVKCCSVSLDYSQLEPSAQKEFEQLDPSKGDGEFSCADVEQLSKEHDSDKHLKFIYLARRFSADLNDWFRFDFPREFSLSEKLDEKFKTVVEIESVKDQETVTKLYNFLQKYKDTLQQKFIEEKKAAAEDGKCAGTCLSSSAIVAILLNDEFGINAKIGESNKLFHRWVEISIDEIDYILDFTADQYDITTEADTENTIAPVLIPRNKIKNYPYLVFLYGNYSTLDVTELNKEYFRTDLDQIMQKAEK